MTKIGRRIVIVSVILAILVFGLVFITRGLAANNDSVTAALASTSNAENSFSGTTFKDGYQEIRMDVTNSGWQPNKFVLKTGVPVKWIINGKELNGCNSGIQVPQLGLRFDIKPGEQTIEFTPTESGTISWSCLMGMIPGRFVVKEEVNANSVQEELNNLNVPQGGSCGMGQGCGCGAR